MGDRMYSKLGEAEGVVFLFKLPVAPSGGNFLALRVGVAMPATSMGELEELCVRRGSNVVHVFFHFIFQ